MHRCETGKIIYKKQSKPFNPFPLKFQREEGMSVFKFVDHSSLWSECLCPHLSSYIEILTPNVMELGGHLGGD